MLPDLPMVERTAPTIWLQRSPNQLLLGERERITDLGYQLSDRLAVSMLFPNPPPGR